MEIDAVGAAPLPQPSQSPPAAGPPPSGAEAKRAAGAPGDCLYRLDAVVSHKGGRTQWGHYITDAHSHEVRAAAAACPTAPAAPCACACLPASFERAAHARPQNAAVWLRYDDTKVEHIQRAKVLHDCECDGYLFFYINPKLQDRACGL